VSSIAVVRAIVLVLLAAHVAAVDTEPDSCVDLTVAAWDRFDRELETRACAARGRWVWSGTTFVRAKPSRRSP
jgi:hypothetical protein